MALLFSTVFLMLGAAAKPIAQSPPAFDSALADLLPLFLQKVAYGPAPKGCSDFELIVARGTGEPGPFGVVVGDSLVRSVTTEIPGSRGYAVQYPAYMNVTDSVPVGVTDIINRLNGQAKACPKQKFALVGYSQGAGIMHGALNPNAKPKLDTSVFDRILALVMFGDPAYKGETGPFPTGSTTFPTVLYERLRENCAPGDPVCDPKPMGFERHLEYVNEPWQKDSVAFIVAAFKGQPLPKSPRTAKEAAAMSAPKAS